MSFLKVSGLCKSFPSNNGELVPVIKDISFEIREGDFVSFFGPNGCGKTTLLFVLAGVESFDSGSIVLRDTEMTCHRVGFVFQNYRDALLPWKNNLENLAFPLELQGNSKKDRERIARELIEDLHLNIDTQSYPYQLSGGQQQLLSIARALLAKPELLFLDEPLSSLDFQTSLRMCDEIQEIWMRTKISTIFVSHDIEDAIYLSDRIYMLSKRPATVTKVLDVNLPRPRNAETRKLSEFFKLRNQALDIFKEIATL